MSRSVNGPWFRSGKNTWYATLEGKKVSLKVHGKENEAEAVRAWHRLMGGMPLDAPSMPLAASPKPLKASSEAKPASIQEVIDGFLADADGRVSSGCLRNYRLFLLPFAERYGKRSAEALTVAEAEAYSRKPKWGASYRNGFLGSLVSAFRWAERTRLIIRSPLNGIRKPPKASRGAKALVSAEAHAKLLNEASPFMKAILQLLWLTGARPGEIASLKAEDVDIANRLIVLTEHKTSYLGKSRMVFLSDEAMGILRERIALHPKGLLFRGKKGCRITSIAIGRRLLLFLPKGGFVITTLNRSP